MRRHRDNVLATAAVLGRRAAADAARGHLVVVGVRRRPARPAERRERPAAAARRLRREQGGGGAALRRPASRPAARDGRRGRSPSPARASGRTWRSPGGSLPPAPGGRCGSSAPGAHPRHHRRTAGRACPDRARRARARGPVNVGTGAGHSLAADGRRGRRRARSRCRHGCRAGAAGRGADTLADTRRLRRLIGWVPHTDLAALVRPAGRRAGRCDRRGAIEAVSADGDPAPRTAGPRCGRRWSLVFAVAFVACGAAGIGVRATYGAHVAVDEPQYLLSALSPGRGRRPRHRRRAARTGAGGTSRRRTAGADRVLADGRQISPHDPLLPLLLAVPMGLGGWVARRSTLALLAGCSRR